MRSSVFGAAYGTIEGGTAIVSVIGVSVGSLVPVSVAAGFWVITIQLCVGFGIGSLFSLCHLMSVKEASVF
ncbi:MAG: hypothetical protein ACI97A_003884, partial [Planctomycetota bacterium]